MSEPLYFYTKTMPFWGLSNFAPPGFVYEGVYWPKVEHFFQAQKFSDPSYRERVRRAASPKEARALGQTRELPIRPDWETARDAIMLLALRMKFKDGQAKKLLISTGERRLVESSPFDYYWAAGQDGSGLNKLGELLMQVRDEFQTGDA